MAWLVGQVFFFLDEDSVLEKDTDVLRREKGNLPDRPSQFWHLAEVAHPCTLIK